MWNFFKKKTNNNNMAQKIKITTSFNAPMLSNDLFAANAVDISFKGKASAGNKRDLVAQPFLGLVKGLNFKKFMYPSAGAAASLTHGSMKSPGNGYNMVESEFNTIETKDSFTEYASGVNTVKWGIGFDADLKKLTDATGTGFDLCYNPFFGTIDELRFYMDTYKCKAVEFGSETPGQMDVSNYINKITPWITELRNRYVGTKIIIDSGLVYKDSKSTLDWNSAIKNINADEARYYAQINDRLEKENVFFGPNMDQNYLYLKNYFGTYLPQDVQTFKTTFPLLKMSIGQILIEDNRLDGVQYVDNTPLATWCLGKMWEFIISNQNIIGSAYWMSLKNLIDKSDETDNNYSILKQIGSLFTGTRQIQQVSFDNMPDVSGVAFTNTTGGFSLLINNGSTTEYSPILYNNGIQLSSVSFTSQRRYASSWNSNQIGDVSVATKLTIPALCSMVVNF